jgi:hypothetical protein
MAVPYDMDAALERVLEQGTEELRELRRVMAPPEIERAVVYKYERLVDDIRKGRVMDMGWNGAMGAIGGGGSGMSAAQAAQNIYGAGLGNQTQNAQNQLAKSALQNAGMASVAQGMKPAEAEEGVLLFHGAPLPEKWLGAHYALGVRAPVGKQWRINFTSEFSSDTIMLWLSMEKYSGIEADKVAATYLETINQRRLG